MWPSSRSSQRSRPSPPRRPSSGSAGGTSTASWAVPGGRPVDAHRLVAAAPGRTRRHLGRDGLPSAIRIRRVRTPRGSSSPSRASAPAARGFRFEAAAPNELWQSDFTHWRLADGTEIEIIDWLDDHSRYLLRLTACARVAGDDVVATFLAAGEAHGWPVSTLTDNAAVYTSRFTGGRNGFESLLAYLGIRQKNGTPGHPQTQGKVERFHQTLKRGLGRQPAARSLVELQAQLDRFRFVYNEHRPHRATGRATPAEAYAARPRAHPAGRGGARATSACATTPPTRRAPSPCGGRAPAPPPGRRRPTPAGGSSPSSTSTRSRSSPSTPASSSRAT